MMPVATLQNAASRPALANRNRSVQCTAQKASSIQQFAAAAVVSASLLAAAPAFADGVSFVNPSNGKAVASPVHVEFAVDGLTVRPAADGLIPGTGHFHVYVDVPAAQQPGEGEAIPFDNAHKHFGKGQTAADLELESGKHTLTLAFANALHESYGPTYTQSIQVNVK
ncbi:hypothetical protein COO60DRAFT_1298674 [Scenedesmus sp. NREL 46B-D3]|nr:hypothetical protein COO60DRAFT_1298674 [Scenedesmus sp. NREL 46B-D3]